MPEGPPPTPRPPGAPVDRPGAPPPAPGPRARTALAWAVIVLVVAAVQAVQGFSGKDRDGGGSLALETMRQQVQTQYGLQGMLGPLAGPSRSALASNAFEQMEAAFGRGPVSQRQRFAVVAGDMRGAPEAVRVLDEAERVLAGRGRGLEGEAREVQEALRALYGDEGVPPAEAAARLGEERRALLRSELGWFGDLALAPAGSPGRDGVLAPARRIAKLQIAIGAGAVAAVLVSLAAGIACLLAARRRGVRLRLAPGAAPHGVYAETFAAWILLFLLLSLGAGLAGEIVAPGGSGILPGAVALVLSLGSLAWPVLRGVPWETVRDDVALRLPATPVRDALAGIGCWFLALPVMAGALLVSVLLLLAQGALRGEPDPLEAAEFPSHPIAAEVARGLPWIVVIVLASVLAPVVEETFFRGVLYRHLRGATGGGARWASVGISGLLSSFLFAAVHPQGLVAVPLLMAVAFPLVAAREWRGSLLAPVAAHAFHNALVTTVFVAAFRGG